MLFHPDGLGVVMSQFLGVQTRSAKFLSSERPKYSLVKAPRLLLVLNNCWARFQMFAEHSLQIYNLFRFFEAEMLCIPSGWPLLINHSGWPFLLGLFLETAFLTLNTARLAGDSCLARSPKDSPWIPWTHSNNAWSLQFGHPREKYAKVYVADRIPRMPEPHFRNPKHLLISLLWLWCRRVWWCADSEQNGRRESEKMRLQIMASKNMLAKQS